MEAEKAFARARAPRFLRRWMSSCRDACRQLAVFDEACRTAVAGTLRGAHEVPLDAIRGTVEPNRASAFDGSFRPRAQTRCRWLRVWRAEREGAALPPISIVRVGDHFAVRDGHHRVSVAKASGRTMIRAVIA